jgi:hypothetical protein
MLPAWLCLAHCSFAATIDLSDLHRCHVRHKCNVDLLQALTQPDLTQPDPKQLKRLNAVMRPSSLLAQQARPGAYSDVWWFDALLDSHRHSRSNCVDCKH